MNRFTKWRFRRKVLRRIREGRKQFHQWVRDNPEEAVDYLWDAGYADDPAGAVQKIIEQGRLKS